jgi:PAS domain S-box-containing protein
VNTDITERKRAEQAVRESEALMRATVETSVEGIILIDATGTVWIYNQACERLFGYEADEVVGRNINMLMPPPTRDEHDGYLRRYFETGEKKIIGIGREVVGRRKDGSTVSLDLSIGEVSIGDTRAFVGVMRDISERKLLERQRLHAEKMEALGVLASGVAHEFNNMLFAIIGLTESVKNTLPEDSEERYSLEGVLEAGARAKDLVRQILAFSRQDEVRPRPIDTQSIVSEALRLARATLPATVVIRQSLDTACGPVLVDPTHVHQIILNLASNGADAMKEKGGLLDVSLDQVIADDKLMARFPQLAPGPYARLTVRDTGHGMDERTLGRIFDPFFTTKDRDAGTGMGLAVVHGIVTGYHGVIDVSSEWSHGTTFEIYLPIWPGGDEGSESDATRLEGRAGTGG